MSFIDYLDQIEDHRTDINKEYNLGDIIFLTVAAVLVVTKAFCRLSRTLVTSMRLVDCADRSFGPRLTPHS